MDNTAALEKADVCLSWLDFVYAFKEVQFNIQESRDKDWYKLNPSDVFYLGCETLIENDEKRLKMNNIVISMENIQPKLLLKPDLLEEIINLLFQMFTLGENSQSFQTKKTATLISGIVDSCDSDYCLSYWVYPLLLQNWDQIKVKEKLLSTSLGDQIERLQRKMLDKYENDSLIKILQDSLSLPTFSHIQICSWVEHYDQDQTNQMLHFLNATEIFGELNKATEEDKATNTMLKIVDVMFSFCQQHSWQDGDDDDQNGEELISDYGHWLVELIQKCKEDFDARTLNPLLNYIFLDLMDRRYAVSTLEEFFDLIRTKGILSITLDYVKDFDVKWHSLLLCDLFQFLSSGTEMDVNRYQLLIVHLPNITSIGFGYKDAEIVSLLLKYGAVSFYSKHHKELLTTSLHFITSLHKLFKTNEEIKTENMFIQKRIESLNIAMKTIDDLLQFIPSTKDFNTNTDCVCEDKVETSPLNALNLPCEDEVETSSLSAPNSPDNFITLLKSILCLACQMIKTGVSINYTFASLLPKLFYRTDYPEIPSRHPIHFFPDSTKKKSVLTWKVRKHELAIDILSLCITCHEQKVGSAFQICGVMVPKLSKNLDRTGLKDEAKCNILQGFVRFCSERMEFSQHINTLITHGLDLISLLMPMDQVEGDTLEQFLVDIVESVEKLGGTSSLILLKTACDNLMPKLPMEESQLKALFLYLLRRCNRNDIRNVFMLSCNWLVNDRFVEIRQLLYRFADKKINSKGLQGIAEIMTTLISIEGKLKESYPDLVNTSLDSIVAGVDETNLKNFNSSALKDLLRLSLYQSLVPEKLEWFLRQGIPATGVLDKLQSELPRAVAGDDVTMVWLQTCSRRISQMQVPRYIKLQQLLSGLMKSFIVVYEEEGITLVDRHRIFEDSLQQLPWNNKKRNDLQQHGYKDDFWSKPIDIEVATDGMLNLDENLRQSLLSCYAEYVEILNSLNIPSVIIDGQTVKTSDIFSDELSLADLKGRRSIVVKAIDKNVEGNQNSLLEKKFSLQLREEKIENDLQEMASKPPKPQTFSIRLNRTFYECSLCCGQQIIGCYSPVGGEHCERPLEIGFRSDCGFVSIYHEGVEIENSEFILTNQGLYLYKAYTSGHPYDTSEIWMAFFVKVLEEEDLLPAIILPHHYPNKVTWENLRRWVSPDVVCTYITCDFDYSTEWRTYYDSRPEFIGNGKDIILAKGFTSKERKTSFSFQRQISVNLNKDFGGLLSDFVMQQLLEDPELKVFRFLGKQLVLLLNNLIETGVWKVEILSDNFNFDRWKKNLKDDRLKEFSKDDVIDMLDNFMLENVEKYLRDINLQSLLFQQRRQFHQLRGLLVKNVRSGQQVLKQTTTSLLPNLETMLKSHLICIPITSLTQGIQEELIHWIFENEDRVWRFRGGREFETLSQFLNFLPHHNKEARCFPGVIVYLNQNKHQNFETSIIKISNVVGYAIGEYVDDEGDDGRISADVYEIVTAWIHPKYRGLKLSTEVYLEIFKLVASKYVTFDLLRHRVERVIDSSMLLKILKRVLRKGHYFMVEKSYEVKTERGVEQFEKVTINRIPIGVCFRLKDFYFSYRILILSAIILILSFLFSVLFF